MEQSANNSLCMCVCVCVLSVLFVCGCGCQVACLRCRTKHQLRPHSQTLEHTQSGGNRVCVSGRACVCVCVCVCLCVCSTPQTVNHRFDFAYPEDAVTSANTTTHSLSLFHGPPLCLPYTYQLLRAASILPLPCLYLTVHTKPHPTSPPTSPVSPPPRLSVLLTVKIL